MIPDVADGRVGDRRPGGEPADGLLVVDKPRGPTSHDVVQEARRLYATSRVGHAGTLDPMASGVLVLLLGEALKLSSYLAAEVKRYRAVVSFGRATDSFDADGRTTLERALPEGALRLEAVEPALELERARAAQVPPAISAIKLGGRRAHRVSRSGQPVELAARNVAVHALELLELHSDRLSVELVVSKGYYVRALARDLGEALGLPAHLSELRRVASGNFRLEEAVSWPQTRPVTLLPTATAAGRALPTFRLQSGGVERARRGIRLEASDFDQPPESEGVSAWIAPDGSLVALGRRETDAGYRVLRGFRP